MAMPIEWPVKCLHWKAYYRAAQQACYQGNFFGGGWGGCFSKLP